MRKGICSYRNSVIVGTELELQLNHQVGSGDRSHLQVGGKSQNTKS